MLVTNHFLQLLTLLFLLSFITSKQTNNSIPSKCYDHYPTFNKNGPKSIIKSNDCSINPNQLQPPTSLLKSNYGKYNGNHTMITSSDSKVQVYLSCVGTKDLCNNIQNGFISTALFLENIINFTQPILIKASFYPFCQSMGQCPEGNSYMVGQAGPLRSLPISDDKGVVRLYPQSLHKQLITSKEESTKYNQYDIFAEFNSEAPYYFPNSKVKGGDKVNFLDVISHELLHGLGFASSINDNFNTGLVTFYPDIVLKEMKDSKLIKVQFIQFIFDKFLVISKADNYVEKYLNLFNQNNLLDPVNPLKEGSKLENIAKELTKQVTIKDNLFFQINKDTLITLETSLVPYAPGSSISHLDKSKYLNTADSLMCYRMEDKDIYQVMKSIGAWNTAPYGPNTLAILEAMGYTLTKNPSQEHSYNMLYSPNSHSSTINFKVNLSFFFIPLILSLIN